MTDFAEFAFAELVAASNYSFLRGASHPADMVAAAIAAGHRGIGIADRNTVAGVVRAHVALKEVQEKASEPIPFRLIVGARLVFADGTPDIVAYPATRFGWGRLTRLLTVGNLRAKKGDCELRFDDLLEHIADLLLIVMPDVSLALSPFPRHSRESGNPSIRSHFVDCEVDPRFRGNDEGGSGPRLIVDNTRHPAPPSRHPRGGKGDDLIWAVAKLTEAAPGRVWLGATMARSGRDRRRLARLGRLAEAAGVPMIATNDALYATPEQRPLHDIVTCIREGTTIAEAGRRLEANAERHVKSGAEMARLFADHPEAIAETVALLDRIGFTLDQLRYEYPHEPVPDGWTPQAWLEHLVEEGIKERYPDGEPDGLRTILDEELHLVRKVKYAYYFLTVHDIVRFARSKGILCQGRGSAANSIICYLLNITAVDPLHHKLLFSRFISEDRHEPPDIDVDFEHERREEVMQYVYERYGRERAGIAATVIHYRPRSAVREVGKVLGLSEDVTARISSTVWGSYASHMEEGRFHESGFDPGNPDIARLGMLVAQLLEFPRHLSQHVGGFVLTEDRLDETVPIHNAAMEDRTFIEWDKDDIDALGLMKVDILALGMLTCIRKAFDLIEAHLGTRYDLANVPGEDRSVYDMLCKGDSIGVFQVESRAQINMLPRLKPRTFYDLVIQVAIVRPGPIQGGMVHPYLRRRQGIETVCFPSPSPECGPADELVGVLGKTLGVPLFQEQAMKLAIVAAGFTPADANRLRRAMATFRNVGTMPQFEAQMVGGMVGRGYDPDFARRCFDQIKGFGSYGFPESHALSFARLVYVSSYLKQYYPAVFACALLNSQPMGFYAPAQIVRDAREHGVEVLPADVNASGWDNSLEWVNGRLALRIGFRQIDGFREEWAGAIKPSPPLGGEGWERGESGGAGRDMASSTAPSPRPASPRNRADRAPGTICGMPGAIHTRLLGDAPPKGGEGGFCTIESLARRANLPPRALRLLADADAFRSIGLDRRQALWEVRRTPTGALPLFAAARARELGEEPDAALPAMPLSEHVAADYQTTRLSLKDHPMAFLRSLFRSENVASCREVSEARNGRRIRVAGIVLVRQRPGEGKAIFITLEDETGITNVLLWARLFRIQRREVMAARLMEVEGEVQRSPEGVVHLMGVRVHDRTAELDRLSEDHQPTIALSRADVFEHPQPPRDHVPRGSHPRDVRILPKSRDFH